MKAPIGKESLTMSRGTSDQEPGCVIGDCISELKNSVNDVTSLPGENSNESDKPVSLKKTIQMDNKNTVSSKESNEERLVLLALEKGAYQKSDEF